MMSPARRLWNIAPIDRSSCIKSVKNVVFDSAKVYAEPLEKAMSTHRHFLGDIGTPPQAITEQQCNSGWTSPRSLDATSRLHE
jgi:hypothetical protein